MPKVGSNFTYLVVINIDSALKKYENYYPEAFLKEKEWLDILRYIYLPVLVLMKITSVTKKIFKKYSLININIFF